MGSLLLLARGNKGAPLPMAGEIISLLISMTTLTLITYFLTRRIQTITAWNRLPFVVWIALAIFADSYMFVFVTAILSFPVGVNSSFGVCQGAILLCLTCYITTKLIYLFLVERAHIVRGSTKSRLKSKLYLFNSVGVMCVFAIVGVLNFVYRIVRLDDGQCFIGMEGVGIIPLITFDTLANCYLTILFLIPLNNLYTFKNMEKTAANIRLRRVALRTFIGAVLTTIFSVVNLSVLAALHGEEGWICLACCNVDVLLCSIVIYWVTVKDNAGTQTARSGVSCARCVSGYGDGSSTLPSRRGGGGGLGANSSSLGRPSSSDGILVTHSGQQTSDVDSEKNAGLSMPPTPTGPVRVSTIPVKPDCSK